VMVTKIEHLSTEHPSFLSGCSDTVTALAGNPLRN
jgi:hypothetical protein